jgi:thiosulfate/3-mercaptopyruvate sulfurtransferase
MYCGSGIAASCSAFALSMLGRENVAVYDGSLTEWSNDPSLPMEIG